jgi:signal transduction histidine kinase
MIFKNHSIRFRLLAWVALYAGLLSLAVVSQGYFVNERAEELIWESLLKFELDHFVERKKADPNYRWLDEHALKLYSEESPGMPELLKGLDEGVHDELRIDGREFVVLAQDVDGRRHVLTLDITQLERSESELVGVLAASAVALVLVMGGLIAWGLGRVVRPLTDMAAEIGRLEPERNGQRIALEADASAELLVIASALNGYLLRNEQFVERERAFINSASHELRTPIAVIAGSAQLSLDHAGLPPQVHTHLLRIHTAARGVEELITLLLVLAKDPQRLARISDRLSLDGLLPGIVEDHRQLTRGKDLVLTLASLPACEIVAPLPVVQSAIGNLLRNAIENSDRGEIVIRLEPDATVVIQDPGHGMSPQEIADIYASLARGSRGREQGGIGLALIARLCEHLGWTLRIDSEPDRGTRTTLTFACPVPHSSPHSFPHSTTR